ncbi:MAG: metallophosphoesterase family protein [Clostridia bacterium]|jgi:putative phosphoesterase|nr:metallophosphoesterase family protein [Clostridia bacterium]
MGKKIIGIISDTHGLLREEARLALAKAEIIIHAGDVGSPGILDDLGRIAKVAAVRGNTDREEWAGVLPKSQCLEYAGLNIYVIHNLQQLDLDPVAAGMNLVIYGHSHMPEIRNRGKVTYINPGSAGPKRFSLPITLAVAQVDGQKIEAEIIKLLD